MCQDVREARDDDQEAAEPIQARLRRAALLTGGGHAAQAQDNVFELGKLSVITVIGEAHDSDMTDNTVTVEDVWTFNRNTLDEAIKLIPGVTSTLDGTARRNERGIFVRGFGRWQVPLSIDGIRIYLPADNRLDFNRFLTQDLAEIEVQKGYVSVLDGPGGMGGAINLVTRKPTEPFEAELRAGFSEGERTPTPWLGTRQERFYVQGSVSYLDRDYWELSDDFVPTAIEDGGERNGSDNRDSRANFKVGFTPNDTDEYSLSYTAQTGEKGAPLHVYNNPPNPPNSFWRWPTWDIGNLYWLSSTQLGPTTTSCSRPSCSTTRTRTRCSPTTTRRTRRSRRPAVSRASTTTRATAAASRSAASLGDRNTFGSAFHYRRDEHTEFNDNRPTSPTFRSVEPVQETLEDTWSLAVENTFAATDKLDLVAGLSHDANELKKAQEFNADGGSVRLSDRRHRRDERAGRGLLAVHDGAPAARRHFLAHPLPDDLRALQHAFRYRATESRSRARARHQLRDRLGRAARRTSSTSRRRCSMPTSRT